MDYPGKVITKNQVTPTQTSASGNWTLDDAAAATKNNNWPVALVPNPISKSLRFNSADTAYLNRTPASASNRRTWTWSGWIKRSSAKYSLLFAAGNTNDIWNTSSTTQIGWLANTDSISVYDNGTYFRTTTQVFRDFSAWGHLVVAVDTTQATAANRVKMYWNGVEITAFATSNNPTQNADTFVNAAHNHVIGGQQTNVANSYYDGYVTEVNFIDGQALTPSSFGMTNPQTGQWIPIKYSGTYGTNGFYLNFKDATSTTTLGYDYSGNANNWTTNNFSVTAGSGNDSLTDVPTPWVAYNTTGDVGGVVRGNYCTWNPLSKNSNITTSNGNLEAVNSSAAWYNAKATIGNSSGKWYWECVLTSGIYAHFGIATGAADVSGYQITGVWSYGNDGSKVVNGTITAGWGATFTTNDVIGVAFDADAGTLTVYKNNVSQGTLATGLTSGPYFPFASIYQSTATINFGQRPFAYTPPAGFLSLCSTNLPTPTIGFGLTNQGDDYFNAVLYTGDGTSSRAITGVGFQPDFVWFKSRSNAVSHRLFDVLRNNSDTLITNSNNAESTGWTNDFQGYNSDGFTVGTGTGLNLNTSAYTMVAWNWKANGAGSTNTAGSITSTVSANTTSGFSIATFTQLSGSPYVGTVGHGLGVAPSMVIIKDRSMANGWLVYHASLGATKYLVLNSTAAAATGSNAFNDTAPTSTVFTTAAGSTYWGNAGATAVAYCFAAVAGYSAFGSFTGNGSADGPFVFLGFRPAFVMAKLSSATGDWNMVDDTRQVYNDASGNPVLRANLSSAEEDVDTMQGQMDLLSNGFKLRSNNSSLNLNGGTIIYAAFAESPFKFANAR